MEPLGCRYPLAAPYGSALQNTKRVTRYWALHDQVTSATAAAAAARAPSTAAADAAALAQSQETSSQLPSLLQVMQKSLLQRFRHPGLCFSQVKRRVNNTTQCRTGPCDHPAACKPTVCRDCTRHTLLENLLRLATDFCSSHALNIFGQSG